MPYEDVVVEAQLNIEPPASTSPWRESWQRLQRDRVGMACLVYLAFIAVAALAAPLISDYITHHHPNDQDLLAAFGGPTHHHWLGTDELGRDTLTRLVWGARVSVEVALLAVTMYLSIGAFIGILAGFYGRTVDAVITRLIDVLLSIPAIFLLLLVATLLPLRLGPITLRQNGTTLAVVIALISWGGVARLARAETLALRSREFVEAALSLGARDGWIIRKHVLPNIAPTLIVAASVGIAQVILLEAAVDFIGVGVQLPTPSWGNMLLNAQSYFYRAPMLAVYPGACIFLAVLAATLVGNSVRDAFDPRTR
jgi:peptide/nickel transport system permease protein